MSFKTALIGLVMSNSIALASVEWTYSQVPDYEIDIEAQASHCEIYIEDFATYTHGYRGASGKRLSAGIMTRYGDDLLNVGVIARVYEESSYRNSTGERVQFSGEKLIGSLNNAIYQGWDFTAPAKVSLDVEWNSFGNSIGKRQVLGFNYFVDLEQDGLVKRLWLNELAYPFTEADFDSQVYSFSAPILSGYGHLRYLYQDSSSPLFFARNACQ